MPQLEDLKLSEDQAEAIIEKGIEYGAYSDEMPDTKKGKLAAADEIVSFSIDAYINDGITSEDDDPAVAESGGQIEEIMDLAGVAIEDGEAVFGDVPDAEGDNGGDEEEGEEEEPFNPDDYIEGYSELSVVSKLKAIKGLDLDSDEDVQILNAVYDWENEQEKPTSRVLNWIDEHLGEPEGEEEAPEAEEPEEEEPEAEEEEAEESDEPWDGYDKATATQIKKVLSEAAEDDELSAEQLDYVLEYEQARKAPRKRIIEHCQALLEQIAQGDEEEEPEEPEKPAKRRGKKAAKKAEPEPEADESGTLTITLNGDTLGEFDAASVLNVVAAIADQVENGATSLALEVS